MNGPYLNRIDGIYDQKTLKQLLDYGVEHFSFDFRPRSFNFIPQYVFAQFLEQLNLTAALKIYMHFAGDSEFLVKKFLSDAKDSLALSPYRPPPELVLEFSDTQSASYYDHFELPYFWHLRPFMKFEDFLTGKNLQGVILSMSHLVELERKQRLEEFIAKFLQVKVQRPKLEVILSMDFAQELKQELVEYLDINIVSFSLDRSCEISYRRPNIPRIIEGLNKS